MATTACVLTGVLGAAMAAAAPTETTGHPTPAAVLAGLQDWVEGTRDLEARFSQVLVSGALGADVAEKGRLYLRRPGAMRWDYREPEPKLALIRGDRTWLYLEQDRQVVLGQLGTEDAWLTALLMGRGSLADAFDPVSLEPAEEGGRSLWQLVLAPRGADTAAERVTVRLQQADYAIDSVEVWDAGGNRVLYSFDKLRRNHGLDERLFDFEPPPGTEIVGSH